MKDFNLKRIARLARVHFQEDELALIESQVTDVLDFIDQLKKVDVEGVEPTSHPLSLENVFREDEIKPSISIKEFLKSSPCAQESFFGVPKVIEDR